MQLAKVENGQVTASTGGIALLVAIVAIVPEVVTAVADRFVSTSTVALETAKLDLERQKAATTLYQTVLVNPDPTQRQVMLRFLVKAGVLKDDGALVVMPPEQIPQWPSTESASLP